MNNRPLQSKALSAVQKAARRVRKMARRIFTGIGAVVTVVMIGAIFFGAEKMPDKILLTYTFREGLGAHGARPSMSGPLLRAPVVLEDVTAALDAAASDDRVKGFVAKIETLDLSPAQLQEIRGAVARFRAAGKFAEMYAGTYGGMGAGMGDYYLASAFDTVWLQPVGMVAVSGIAAQVPFAKDLLGKIGAEAQFGHKGKYKSAPESLTANAMGPDNRENLQSIISDLSDQVMDDIASARGIAPLDMAAIRDSSPYTDKAALKLKLVDRLGYEDEMVAGAKIRAGLREGDRAVALDDYIDDHKGGRFTAAFGADKKIALVYGSGEIVPVAGAGLADGRMGADEISDAFNSILDDDDVAAVVFRIDSPGGSPEAAETIHRAIERVQKSGRLVVVSMGGYAASGGYWIAAPADKIIAQPGTITGSIGVFGGKIVLEQLWKKIGLNWETVAAGKNADMWSANRKFSDTEFARFEQLLDDTYESFLQRVMAGRHMTHDRAAALAEGRVYTGRQAKDEGLVDALGGLDVAVAAAKELAKIDAVADVPVVTYPPEKTRLENMTKMLVGDPQAALLPSVRLDAREMLHRLFLQGGTVPHIVW